jgi:hypothetical protein
MTWVLIDFLPKMNVPAYQVGKQSLFDIEGLSLVKIVRTGKKPSKTKINTHVNVLKY